MYCQCQFLYIEQIKNIFNTQIADIGKEIDAYQLRNQFPLT